MSIAAVVNTQVLQMFKARRDNNRLAHAYLFIAPKGAGKTATAKAVAQLVNCDAGPLAPCGQCPSCLKIQGGNHPDIHVVEPDEDVIKVDHVRNLLSRAQLRAYEAHQKVFIIPEVNRMTSEAANAFLKTLEEPAAQTLMILTTHVPHLVLDTIKSRCHWVRFNPEGFQACSKRLEGAGASLSEAQFMSQLAQGWSQVALSRWEGGLYSRKQEVIAQMFIKGLTDETIKQWAEDPLEAEEALTFLMSVIRDAFVYQATGDTTCLWHQDALPLVQALSRRSEATLTEILKQAKQIKHQLNENLNAKMAWQILKERLWSPLSK